LTTRLISDSGFPALLIGGSIAQRRGQPDADIDVLVIATENEFAHRVREFDICCETDRADSPGGDVAGRIVSLQVVLDAAQGGSFPTRAAFKGAIITDAHNPDLTEILARIIVFPEDKRADKFKALYRQVWTLRWFLSEAERRADRDLLRWSASELALCSACLLLASNRILCPLHTWLMWELEHAPGAPADLLPNIASLLADPSGATAISLWRVWRRSTIGACPTTRQFHPSPCSTNGIGAPVLLAQPTGRRCLRLKHAMR
jgi:hypothetical protein